MCVGQFHHCWLNRQLACKGGVQFFFWVAHVPPAQHWVFQRVRQYDVSVVPEAHPLPNKVTSQQKSPLFQSGLLISYKCFYETG